jgi:hypothetical protein
MIDADNLTECLDLLNRADDFLVAVRIDQSKTKQKDGNDHYIMFFSSQPAAFGLAEYVREEMRSKWRNMPPLDMEDEEPEDE